MPTMINRQDLLNHAPDILGRRLVTRNDIKPGAEMEMVQVERGGRIRWPQSIKINDEATGKRRGKVYVFYHCDNAPDLQCFVPLDDFIGVEVDEESCGPFMTTFYVVKA